MSHWNYRVTRQRVAMPDGSTEVQYALREVYYDDNGNVQAWTDTPVSFVGDTPGEVIEALHRAARVYPGPNTVYDLDTRESVTVSYHGKDG